MLQIENFGHSSEAKCLEVVTLFASIEDDAQRARVITLLKALATDTGELVALEDITFP
jgi:hypothetical protein